MTCFLTRPARAVLPASGRSLLLVLAALTSLLVPAAAVAHSADPVGVWPLQPTHTVVRAFDPPDSPWGSGHRGVDLLGRPGQGVHAALSGTISFAGLLAGRGVVVVDHGTSRTTYEPVSASVAVGAVVGAGTLIGRLQPAPSHCAPRTCLHWGWIRGDTYLDPLRLVGGGPVRLLPLWRSTPFGSTARGDDSPALLPYAAVLPVDGRADHLDRAAPRRRAGPTEETRRSADGPRPRSGAYAAQALGWACW